MSKPCRPCVRISAFAAEIVAWILRILGAACVATAIVCFIVIALLGDLVTQLQKKLDTD